MITSDSRNIIERAKRKILALEEENKLLKAENDRLSKLETEYHKLQANYDRLKIARSFGQSSEDKQKAYRRLTNMIAEIDKCLKMLND